MKDRLMLNCMNICGMLERPLFSLLRRNCLDNRLDSPFRLIGLPGLVVD